MEIRKKLAAALAVSAMTMACAASCGKDKPEDSAVPELPVLSTESQETTEETTGESTEAVTTVVSTAVTTSSEETETEAVTTEAATEPETEAPTEEETEADDGNNGGDNTEQPQSSDVTFDFADLNGNAASKIAALGSPSSYDTVQGCLSNGADQKIYRYNGLEIQCYILNGTEYIYSVFISDPAYATSKGIKIGSSKWEVENAYGTDYESVRNYYYYYDGDSEIDFEFENDVVKSIEFYTPV